MQNSRGESLGFLMAPFFGTDKNIEVMLGGHCRSYYAWAYGLVVSPECFCHEANEAPIRRGPH